MPGASVSTTAQYAGIGVFIAACIWPARPRPVQALGLLPEDVAVLPTFTYRPASPDSRGDAKGASSPAMVASDCCSVCLDELCEGALVRMLPSCKHYFHAECVVWLLSHATCPVCRGEPGPGECPSRRGVAVAAAPAAAPVRGGGGVSVAGGRRDVGSQAHRLIQVAVSSH